MGGGRLKSIPTSIAGLVIAAAAASADPGIHIVPARVRLSPGEAVQLRAQPPGTETRWTVVSGPGSISRTGLFHAPYVVGPQGATSAIRATSGPKGAQVASEASIEIRGGVYPGADECLAPTQQWSSGGTGLDYVSTDELPMAIIRVAPDYPPSLRARGVIGSLVVNALVCRSGDVLDARPQWGEGIEPIPKLEELAVAAARQWKFKPARLAGQPIAVMVVIPFRFPPP